MHPHPALSQALISEFNGERTRVVRRPSPRHSSPPARRPVPPGGARGRRGRRLRLIRPPGEM